MVDLNLQALDTTTFSKDLYVSVRVGENQKLAKASASRTYHFPKSAIGDRRYARIELFKRIGGSNVVVDPAVLDGGLQEVCVPSEGIKSDIKFRVAVFGEDKAKAAGVDKPESTNQNKKIRDAKEYLEKHSLELRLAEAMQAVLRERPDDPGSYIAQWMMTHVNTVTKITPPAAPTQGAGKVVKSIPLIPFRAYYTANMKSIPSQAFSKFWSKFPSKGMGAPLVTTKPNMTGYSTDEIRKQTSKCLMQASADGTLAKAMLQVRGMDSAPERFQKIRSATVNLLVTACTDGSLERALSQVKKGSGQAFTQLPSVGTWIQHRVYRDGTLEDKAPESFEKIRIDKLRKTTSDLLLQASADGTLDQVLSSVQRRKKGYLISTSALMGSLAYSCGIKLNYRAI